jgi:hypothetical protein
MLLSQFWDYLHSILFNLEPDDPVVSEFSDYSSAILGLAAAIGVALLILMSKPLRTRKRPQDRLIFRECVLVFVMNTLYPLMSLLGQHDVGVFFLIELTVYEGLYMLILLQWLICVDYSLYHSMDHIRRRYRYAWIPVLVVMVLHFIHGLLAMEMVDGGDWGYYGQYVLIILKRVIEFGYIATAVHLVHDYEKEKREPRFLRLDVFIIPFILGVIFRFYDGFFVALGVILTYVVMRRRDKYIDAKTGLFKAEYLDCISAYWDKKGYTDANAMIVSAPGNGEKLAEILQNTRIMDCFMIRMDEDSFVVLTGKLRSSAVKMVEMSLAEETEQYDPPFNTEILSLEREKGQSAAAFADRIKETLRGSH